MSSGCFNCRNQTNGRIVEPGWRYDCKLGLNNEHIKTIKDMSGCPMCEPQLGFQVGGYYSHMFFVRYSPMKENNCLEWHILSNGDFPKKENEPHIQLHICDFEQLERFVEFWREELEKRGWIGPREVE